MFVQQNNSSVWVYSTDQSKITAELVHPVTVPQLWLLFAEDDNNVFEGAEDYTIIATSNEDPNEDLMVQNYIEFTEHLIAKQKRLNV